MCKKLMFLISLVLVLGLVGSVSAQHNWTNADPADDLWTTPGNWDLGSVPVSLALINSPPVQGPVINTDIAVGEIGGLRLDSDSDQVMDITSGNVQIGWWWGLAEAGNGTATLNMVGDASIAVGGIEAGYSGATVINIGGTTHIESMEWRMCNEDGATVELNITDDADIQMGPEKNAWRFADKGTMVTNISGNANVYIDGKWRNGDETGHSVINMSGGTLYVARYLSCYDDGMATINFSGGTVDVDGLNYAGGGGDLAANPYELNVSGSANVTARTEIRLGYQADPLNVTQASVTVNVSGGTLQTPGPFNAFGAKCPVNMSLTGGEIRCGSFQDQPDVRPYSLVICGGELIIDGDVTAQIQADIDAGYITGCAYGSAPKVEFDGGKTTLSTPTEYRYTGDYPWSYLWISPWNWDPVGVPSTCDHEATIEDSPDPIILDTDIEVGNILVRLGNFDQDIHIMKGADVHVCDRVEIRDDPCLATVTISDKAVLSTGSLRVHGDNGDAVINMTENAQLICRNDLRFGDEDNDYFELNMTDDTYLFVEDDDDRMRQNNGEFHIDLSGNAVAEVAMIRARARTENLGVACTITVRESAQLICFSDYLRLAGGASDVTVSVLDDAVVDVDGDFYFGEDNDFKGQAILNMSGQLITMNGGFGFIDDGDAKGFTTVNLTSGLINTEGELWSETDNWLVNICGDGVWVVDGDVVDEILAQADEGHWLACEQEDCRGEMTPRGNLVVEYDTAEYPGKTKISATLDLSQAWAPSPADGATGVASHPELCWCPGEGAHVHHLFFSDDYDLVAARNMAVYMGPLHDGAYCYDPGPLCLGTTYYWVVDEQDAGINITSGNVWQFTVEDCRAIEDMEKYTYNPDLIYEAWKDGCGYWVGDELISNGTGSCVDLSMSIVHGGAKSMWYAYENELISGWERDANYSEATAQLDPPLDLTSSCEAALVLWFHGNRNNASTEMWVFVNDAMATYGANGDDPDDIKKEEWIDWNIDLADLATDLSAVASMSIGFGDKAGNLEQPGVTGVVHFDDISVCRVRCVPKYTPDIYDLNGDCIVDWKDIALIADDAWLTDLR